MDSFAPTKEDKFSFGLWTVGNPGRDPFGDAVREPMDPCHIVRKLAEIGAWGVNLHDNALVPFGASANERDGLVADFREALDASGMVVPMATTNLFTHPVFKDGAFTANDPKVRAFALRKTMDAMDLGTELGATTFVFWGGREGAEADACRDPRDAVKRFRDAINFLCEYVRDQRYDLRFALEPKPNEPRGDIYFPTIGHMLHFITTLDHPAMVGVNPEVAHDTMAGLSFAQGVAQAMEAGKLYHIDLNAQKIGRYDQDLRFGSEDLKQAFLLLRLLEGTSGRPGYDGPRHFDAHAYRTEDEAGVWDFASGCMRTYNILREKAKAFDADGEVQDLLKDQESWEIDPLLQSYSRDNATKIRGLDLDPMALSRRGLGYERLDQIMIEYILGVRG
ncbi:MAG: xylose isomerase [Planctomycetes bacterium]|nr:xylose isomerase [Planctomycetota bacterium]